MEPSSRPLSLGPITAPAEVARFSRFEATIGLAATYDNPFDPKDLDIQAEFEAPDGSRQTAYGFLDRPMRREDGRVVRDGDDAFRVRFTPSQVGAYTYRIRVTDRTGTAESDARTFQATPSEADGFVRRAKDPLYFAFDSGRGYFALGENVCWAGEGDLADYDRWFARLAEAGCNYARLWLGPFTLFTLERTPSGPDDYAGLNRYDLVNAYKLDYVLDLAERHGIYLMLCIDSFNCLRASEPYPAWNTWPYNARNGGPCERPEDYFTSDAAKDLYRKRLRYLVARYGYSPHVMSWEFWNEVDIIERYLPEDVAAWHSEMGQYLRSIDPYDHLITTSYARSDGDPLVDGLPEMDYVQTHNYGSRDCARGLLIFCERKAAAFGKPHYVGEFGTGALAEGNGGDEEGLHLHNGIWATSLAQSAGCAMLWWWDNYVDPNDLYYHFTALSRFLADVDFANEGLVPVEVGEMRYSGATPPEDAPGLLVVGMHNPDRALVWIRNDANTWYNRTQGDVAPVPPSTVELTGLADGDYSVEWWGTWKGEVTRRERVTGANGKLTLAVPELSTDIACKLRR